jgi:hypothetical protein
MTFSIVVNKIRHSAKWQCSVTLSVVYAVTYAECHIFAPYGECHMYAPNAECHIYAPNAECQYNDNPQNDIQLNNE